MDYLLENFSHYLDLTKKFPCRTITYKDTLKNINQRFFNIDAQTSINSLVSRTFEPHDWKPFYSYESRDRILSSIDTWAAIIKSLPIKHPLCIQYYGSISTLHPGNNRLLMYEQIFDPVIVILNDHVGNFEGKNEEIEFDVSDLLFRIVNVHELPTESFTRINSKVDKIKELVPKDQGLHYPTKQDPPARFEWRNNTVYKNDMPIVKLNKRWEFCI